MPQSEITTIICGLIQRETIINRNDQVSIDRPGGHALYAASGYALFDNPVGIVAKVNDKFLEKYGKELTQNGFDLKGVTPSTRPINAMQYYRINAPDQWETSNIKRHFYELGLEVPKFLLQQDIHTKYDSSTIKAEDIPLLSSDFPPEYRSAQAVLLTPMSFISHNASIPFLKKSGVSTLMIRSSPSYMTPPKLPTIASLLKGIDFFFTTEQEIRTLFKSRFDRYEEMLSALKGFGEQYCIIKCQKSGYMILQADSTQICVVPDYAVFVIDPIGDFDCFCGVFAANYAKNQLPVKECALKASAAASICREGSGIDYILQSLPALIRMRAQTLYRQLTWCSLSSLAN
ncbi:MAG TPA: hypothetical protein DCK95_10640 [Anaerolineaceae bacterium]|uniref:Carbohydrate kinase PfkB domain-containing protein n=1 Tax=Anaerolinea thermophila TaxID=167964 RepID=A0A117LH93_9CHLR|nr:MAG: hypothetical protein XD73_0107 [Anaerolinea thermophila]HAF62765.1 hypothetical protein [Anaerolineaceae bacterium]